MKKLFFGLLAIMVSVTLFAERITSDDAALVANNFMNVAPAPGVKKAVPQKKMVRKATAEENLFYVYENEGGEGWVIVAANDAVTPILAYSETGHFRTDNMPTNVRTWLGKYNNFITKIEADGVVAGEEAAEEWNALRKGVRKANAAAVVGPLVKTTWDQDSPYWNLCPGSGTTKAYTGCVATAMAQVMNYWQWPVKGTGSRTYQPMDPNSDSGAKSKRYGKQTANFGETTYDWANMKNSYSGSYTESEAKAVATLMFHCGVATEMMYGNDADGGSGTYTVNYEDWDWGSNQGECAQNALANYFRYKKDGLTGYMRSGYTYQGTQYYKKWSDAEWTAMIKEELDKLHPIMYAGAGSGGGHSFVCDGYDSNGKFHFNWGWSGSNDGYYTLSKLAPGSGGAGGGSYDFSENQDVIIGVVPDRQDLPTVTVTWSVNGVTSTSEFTQEDALVLPAEPVACDGKEFVGWTVEKSVKGDKPIDLFKSAAGKTVGGNVTYYAVFAEVSGEGGASVEDKLTRETTGISGQNYGVWSGKKVASDAVYFGNSAGGNSTIQLRSKNSNSGICTSVSGGKLNKVVVEWHESSASGRKLDIYAKNEAYSDPSQLYTNSTQGELVGSITCGTNNELLIPGSYAYVGVRSNNGSLYLNSITFVWGGGATYSNYTTNCSGEDAVENITVAQPRAVKAIRDGQVVIIRGNEVYSILGVKQ